MRRVLEFVLMAGGAFAFAFGLDLLRYPGHSLTQGLSLAAVGWAALCLGIVLSLKHTAKPGRIPPVAPIATAPGPGPLGAATLAFGAGQPPRVLGSDTALAVSADPDGTIRFKLQGCRAAGGLICRPGTPEGAFFNTLKRDSKELQIKLIGPVPPVLHFELWDRATL